jgi:transposase
VDRQAADARAARAELRARGRAAARQVGARDHRGAAPGSHESAGKRKPVATRRGSHWLRVFLVQAAWAATHAKGTFWKRTFERLRARLGPKQALIAIARKMLVALYHVLKNRTPYRELGADHVPTDQPERRAKKLVHQLKALGFDVQLAPTAVAPT